MIKIENTLKTSVTYNGTGTQTRFDFPFDYLRKAFVYVSVNNALMNNTTDYTIDGRTVVFNTAPASGSVIRIYRETTTDRLVVWADASVLKAADMTIQQVQQLHILEETNDWTKSSSIVLNDEGTAWQGRNYRLTNISDPVDEQDAVTKRYIDNEENSFMATMNALKNQTEQMANQSSTKANNAKKSENAAKLSETNAKNSEIAARTSAAKAGTSREEARSAADAAQTYMNNAKNYSENVNVFIPSVSAAGVLSWTNRAGLDNPTSVNIKGEKGDKGDIGATGAPGAAATIRIGNVYTGEPGTNVNVSNSGTSTDAILNFKIPRGNPGADAVVAVDEVLNATSLNPVANKTVYAALQEKVTTEEIANTYAKKSDVSALMNTKLGVTATAYAATRDGAGNTISTTYAKKTDISGMVKSVNGTAPDSAGNVTINVSGGGGVSTSESNTWMGKQTFQKMKFNFESYNAPRISGTIDNPSSSVAVYNVQGNFTLDMSVLAGLLSNSDATLFTAYITANADYSLIITNAGTLKYVGSASDVAITSAGLLLNIMMLKDASSNVTSIVQASKLS